ncbi:MAG: chemotaxis-specific protein-glutamate methyltransferase CheB [Desulfamplus sp.]|nr:chemotaxis-specific protein-glutamate methyltransferase CheB [Desulfamplus sp.]
MAKNRITVLIIEDSALMRRELTKIINSDDSLQVVDVAVDAEDALEKIRKFEPDVVTIDVNLPGMDGITCLQHIMVESPRPCIMISAYTRRDSVETFEALELGAVDFVEKPSGEISRDIHVRAQDIVSKIKEAAAASLDSLYRFVPEPVKKDRHVSIANKTDKTVPDKVVVIGVSTGGPRTLMQIIPALPEDLDASVIVVQHMPEKFTGSFAARLNEYSRLRVKEARFGDYIAKGEVYVAKGGHHLLLARNTKGISLHVTRPLKKELFVPNINITMNSAIDIFGNRVVGVILTGMGDDGADAISRLYNKKGHTIAESEATAVIYGMPKEVIVRGVAAVVAPSHEIAQKIQGALNNVRA